MSDHYSHLAYGLLFFIIAILLHCTAFANEEQCSIESNKALLKYWFSNQYKQPIDRAFWLTAKQVQSLSNDTIWIDVRSALIQKSNPSNILSIPLNQLESKEFLFDKTVVLVGSGFDQQLLNKAMQDLKGKGFKHIFALSGGIRSWSALKHLLIPISDEISPEEFLLGGKTIHWQVIAVGLTEKDIKVLPEKPTRSFNLSKETAFELNHFLDGYLVSHNVFIRYVLITPNEQTALFLKRQLNLADLTSVVWLKGGLASYQQYIKQQTKLINNTGQSLSKPCRLTL